MKRVVSCVALSVSRRQMTSGVLQHRGGVAGAAASGPLYTCPGRLAPVPPGLALPAARALTTAAEPEYFGNYYLVLDVKMEAGAEEIKAAYYRLSKRYHPDMNQGEEEGAAEKFARLTEAYSVLASEQSRAAYDQWLTTGRGGYNPKRNYPEPGENRVRDRFGSFGAYYRRGR